MKKNNQNNNLSFYIGRKENIKINFNQSDLNTLRELILFLNCNYINSNDLKEFEGLLCEIKDILLIGGRYEKIETLQELKELQDKDTYFKEFKRHNKEYFNQYEK